MELEKSTGKKVICFHGTDSANVPHIRREGFREGTFFAKHLEDALEFGGRWVFQVCFDEEKLPPGCWQFRITESRSQTQIVRLIHYREIEQVFENSDLREVIAESQIEALDCSA